MTEQQVKFFQRMIPGQTLNIDEVKDPILFIESAKLFIDAFGLLEFNDNFTVLTKLHPIPSTNEILYYFEI